MRVNLFVVAAASLSMTVYAQSAIRVPDLGQREGINAADRRALRDPPPGSEVPKPDLLPLISPKNPQPGDSGAGSGSGSSPAAPAPKPNKCLEEGSACAEIIKGATELAQKLIKLLADNAGTTTTSSNFATVITPRPLPDYYVIMATNMSDYLPLLNVDEQRMLSNNRSCFFANIQGYYTAAVRAAAARSSPVAASTTPTTTRYLSPASSLQSKFFLSYMPSRLSSAYAAPRNGPLRIATITCPALNRSGALATATYVWKAATTTTSAATSTTSAATSTTSAATSTTSAAVPPVVTISGGNGIGATSRGPLKVSVLDASFLGIWIILLLV